MTACLPRCKSLQGSGVSTVSALLSGAVHEPVYVIIHASVHGRDTSNAYWGPCSPAYMVAHSAALRVACGDERWACLCKNPKARA